MEPYGRLVRRSVWLCSIYLLLLLANCYGLDPSRRISQYGHTLWRRQDTLISATSEITQTTDGYIWVRTGSPLGLARFDGVNFVPWTPPQDIPFSLRHLSALLGASDGSLWIGTAGGLGRLKDGHFRSYSKPGDRWGIGTIIEDHAGHIWVTRYRVPHGEGAICEVLDQGLHCYGPADGVPLRFGLGLAEDTQGNFWIGSQYLCRWKPGSICATYLNKGSADASIDTLTVASGPSPTVWAVANAFGKNGGLQQFSAGEWSPYSVPGFNGSAIESEAMLVDRDGSLWVGTETDGLYRIHNGMVDHYGPADGLSGHQVAQIYEDREGNLWVTTDGGMDMFRNTPVSSYSVAEGISSAYPNAILASRNGSIWIGTVDGIAVLRDGRKQSLPAWGSRKQATYSFFEDHTGTIWFASGDDLVYRDHGHFHIVKLSRDDPRSTLVTGITEDIQHNLWALSRSYLIQIDQRQVQQYIPLPKNFFDDGLLAPDLEGGLWISDSASHLFRYSNGQFQTMKLKHSGGTDASIQAMIADADDPLLVATLHGLFRWDGQHWSLLDGRNGLACTQLVSIVKDNHGALWLGAENCGFLRIDPSELVKWRRDAGAKVAATVLDRFDGAFPGQKLRAEPDAGRAPDGRLWFANGVDVETFDPDHLFRNSVVPPVHVQTVIADDKSYEPSSALRLPARTRNLEIDYTALSFSVPQKVKFRYQLEGHDTGWQNPGTRRQAFYNDLSPGHYRFHVVACNNDGVWNEAGALLNFSIAPAFYQTNWFRALCAAAFLVFLWALYQLRLRQVHRQFNIGLEARVKERTRVARELHDTLLQSFQGLLLRFQTASNLLPTRPEEAKQKLDNAIDLASQAVTEGRDAVQGLRSSITTTNDLAVAMSALGKELAGNETNQNSPVFRVDVEGEPRELHPLLRDETYRIAGEALRNAFRHSHANRIEVEIHYDANQLRLRIRDNGQGIEPQVIEHDGGVGHWGLHGMRERATIIGGNLEVWSKVESGTEVELTIPGRTAYDTANHHRSWFPWKGTGANS